MATFTVDTKALNSIQNKFKQTAELYKAYAVQEVNKAVKAMEVEARAKAERAVAAVNNMAPI